MADATGSTPIVSPDALRRIRRPGARRRLAVVVFFLLVIAVAVATYVVLSRRIGRVDPLSEYTVATVRSGPLVERVSIAGSVRMARDEVARAPRAGTVAETYRTEGEYVHAGTTLARLESESLDRELRDVERAIERNTGERETLAAELALVTSIAQGRIARLIDARDRLAVELDLTRELHAIGSVATTAVTSAQDALNSASADVDMSRLENQLEELRHARNAELLSQESETLRERLDSLTREIDSLLIRASLSGVVQGLVQPGQYVEQRQTVGRVVDLSSAVIDASVPNRLRESFGVTAQVTIRIGGHDYVGTVTATDTRAVRTGDNNEAFVAIEASIQEPPSGVLEGTPATIAVDVVRSPSTLIVPRGPFYGSSRERYVYRVEVTRAVRTEARFGLVTASEIEILSGVREGDRIVASSYSSFIENESVELTPSDRRAQ